MMLIMILIFLSFFLSVFFGILAFIFEIRRKKVMLDSKEKYPSFYKRLIQTGGYISYNVSYDKNVPIELRKEYSKYNNIYYVSLGLMILFFILGITLIKINF